MDASSVSLLGFVTQTGAGGRPERSGCAVARRPQGTWAGGEVLQLPEVGKATRQREGAAPASGETPFSAIKRFKFFQPSALDGTDSCIAGALGPHRVSEME